MPNARDYCFTLYLADDEQTAFMAVVPTEHFSITPQNSLKYVIYQLERCPTTQRLHWQGYIKFHKCVSLQFIKQHFPILEGAHLERRRGTDTEAIDYCSKEDTRELGPWVIGDTATHQGQRSDLASYAEAVRRHARSGITWKAACRLLAEEFPATHMRFRQHGQGLFQDSQVEMEPEPLEEEREWQQQLLEELRGEPHKRKIIWFCGPEGGEGKSTMALHLVTQHDAIMLSGRNQDMAHAYKNNPARIVIFDLPRGNMEHMDHLYTFAEYLKNGCIFSSKYESTQVTFKRPHVIFFANVHPDMTKWSADRYDIRDI